MERDNLHAQAMLFEPVMGEGNPGVSITREFYDAARRLTKEHHSLLLVDSVQAGLRTQGTLSIVDYPGFEDCEAPDFETWSKAINGGQFPLSIVALSESAASSYVRGLYGNSMTANPRALDVATAVLKQVTSELRENIRARGVQMKTELQQLQVRCEGSSVLAQKGVSGVAEVWHQLAVRHQPLEPWYVLASDRRHADHATVLTRKRICIVRLIFQLW